MGAPPPIISFNSLSEGISSTGSDDALADTSDVGPAGGLVAVEFLAFTESLCRVIVTTPDLIGFTLIVKFAPAPVNFPNVALMALRSSIANPFTASLNRNSATSGAPALSGRWRIMSTVRALAALQSTSPTAPTVSMVAPTASTAGSTHGRTRCGRGVIVFEYSIAPPRSGWCKRAILESGSCLASLLDCDRGFTEVHASLGPLTIVPAANVVDGNVGDVAALS